MAKNYRDKGVPFEDLISEGNLGLYHAAEKYDGKRETRFITYAVWWIKNSLNECIKKSNKINETDIDTLLYGKNKNETFRSEIINEKFEERLNDIQSRNASVNELMECLQERERNVVAMFFGLDGRKEMNLDEIGQVMSLSMERVRQIKDVALIKLKTNVMLMDCDAIRELKESYVDIFKQIDTYNIRNIYRYNLWQEQVRIPLRKMKLKKLNQRLRQK